MSTPTVLRKANGVPPVRSASVKAVQTPSADPPKTGRTKVPLEGQKVVIRRLAPGMTEEECLAILGDEWRPGNGKVGWFSYHPGKVSNDPAKPSKPSRAYLHVKKSDNVLALMDFVRMTDWEDAKETFTSPSLVAPPVLELAIYKKVQSSRIRNDGRQGTIDQDPEFMDFLESLANPDPSKDPEADPAVEEEEKLPVKVSTTPLIDYLREKKANKAKDAANAKAAKQSRHDLQTAKGKPTDDSKRKTRDSKGDKAEKPRETVKILTKKAATEAAAEAANAVASQITAAAREDSSKSRRAGIAAAARILQRDLGLSPGNAHRRARQDAAKVGTDPNTATAAPASPTTAAPPSPATPKGPSKPAVAATEDAASVSQPPTPTAPKASGTGSSSRGPRGKKGAASAAADGQRTKEKKASADKTGEASTPAPKTPVMILKKKDVPPPTPTVAATSQAPPPTTPTATTTTTTKATPSTVAKPSQGGKGSAGGSGSQKKGGAAPAIGPDSKQAFVKHANPSQGVTEILLKEAMQAFGGVTFVEIDRRKGFAYVDFADHGSLVKAIAASPVSVAQATVQVLERKETGKKGGGAASTTAPAAGAGTSGEAGKGGGKGANAAKPPTPKPASTPKADAPAAASSPAPQPAATGEKPAGEHKRGGRRRGGRGRGGDSQAKDGSKDGSGPINKDNKASAGAPAPAAAPA